MKRHKRLVLRFLRRMQLGTTDVVSELIFYSAEVRADNNFVVDLDALKFAFCMPTAFSSGPDRHDAHESIITMILQFAFMIDFTVYT